MVLTLENRVARMSFLPPARPSGEVDEESEDPWSMLVSVPQGGFPHIRSTLQGGCGAYIGLRDSLV